MAKPDNIKNLLSENEGLEYLKRLDKDLISPSLEQKKVLLSLVNLPNIYSRSFDLVKLKVNSFEDVKSSKDFLLVEVKVTKKYLVNFPKGFFFGMTQNEDNLLKQLEGIFIMCLVSVNEMQSSHLYLNHTKLHELIKHKRIQYQINL
jgi:hypothetical protein